MDTDLIEHVFLNNLLPTLNDAHKKTPKEPRINALNNLNRIITYDNFKDYEPYIVENILPIILERFNDKPEVTEIAKRLGINLIRKLSIQSFTYVMQILFVGLSDDSK